MHTQFTPCEACGTVGKVGGTCTFCGTTIALREGVVTSSERVVKKRTVTPQQFAEKVAIYHDVRSYGLFSIVSIGSLHGVINLNGELIYPLGPDAFYGVVGYDTLIKRQHSLDCIDLETQKIVPYIDIVCNELRKSLHENDSLFEQIKQYINSIKEQTADNDKLIVVCRDKSKSACDILSRKPFITIDYRIEDAGLTISYSSLRLSDRRLYTTYLRDIFTGFTSKSLGWNAEAIYLIVMYLAKEHYKCSEMDVMVEPYNKYLAEQDAKKRVEDAIWEKERVQKDAEWQRMQNRGKILEVITGIVIIGLGLTFFIWLFSNLSL